MRRAEFHPYCRKPPKKRNKCTIAAGIPQPAKKTDCNGWLKLVGLQAFMDLKQREQRSLTALRRDTCDFQLFNSDAMHMLGFPTSYERLLMWLRVKGKRRYNRLKMGNLQQLNILYLHSNGLTSVPKEIGNLEQLEELHLGSNKLTSVPKEIGNLGQLQILDLDDNAFASIPKEIGNLKQLERLYVSNNKLTSIRCLRS
jgi:Leucine-rich repeat (LRR) protein